MPKSLRGTQPDGAARFDRNGEPVADAELRRHWYLAALGEQEFQSIRVFSPATHLYSWIRPR